MAVIAYDVNASFEYTLRGDITEPPTIFHLSPLDSALASFLFDNNVRVQATSGGPDASADIVPNIRQRQRDIVRFGVKDWDNFADANGNQIKCERISHGLKRVGPRQGLTDQALNYLTPYIEELAGAIERGNTVTKEDQKNFGMPSNA